MTNSAKVIDLKQQLIGLFDNENVLAFFDFQLTIDRDETVQGLCKISEPKEGQSKSNYLSLFFIIDTTDDSQAAKIDTHIKRIPWGDFKKYLQGIDMVVPIPNVSSGTRQYFKEVEIYPGPHQRATRPYLADALYPAIKKILNCRGGDLFFWDGVSLEEKHIETDHSLIGKIIDYFKHR